MIIAKGNIVQAKENCSQLISYNRNSLDSIIADIQIAINNAFDLAWAETGKTTGGIVCYPLCSITFGKKGKRVEYFDESTDIDYQDILDADTNKMFVLNDYDIYQARGTSNYSTTFLDIIFIVNLKQCYKNINYRATEEFRQDVLKVLNKIPNTSIYKTQSQLNRIFGDIQYDKQIDMHPNHCLKVILSVDRFYQS